MASINDLKSSNFLTQKDVERPVLVTIAGWERVNVAREGTEPEYRYALHFRELDKPMTLNYTNGQIIASIAGSEEFDDWKGHKIVLYRDPNIMFGGKMVGGIRVRAPKTGYTAPPEEPELPEEEDSMPF